MQRKKSNIAIKSYITSSKNPPIMSCAGWLIDLMCPVNAMSFEFLHLQRVKTVSVHGFIAFTLRKLLLIAQGFPLCLRKFPRLLATTRKSPLLHPLALSDWDRWEFPHQLGRHACFRFCPISIIALWVTVSALFSRAYVTVGHSTKWNGSDKLQSKTPCSSKPHEWRNYCTLA